MRFVVLLSVLWGLLCLLVFGAWAPQGVAVFGGGGIAVLWAVYGGLNWAFGPRRVPEPAVIEVLPPRRR